MSRPNISRCDTFFAPSGPKEHLFFVITEGDAGNKVFCVNVTTRPVDNACVLNVGDHPFIRKESYLYYEKARVVRIGDIEDSIHNGRFRLGVEAEPEIVDRIVRGAFRSQAIRVDMLDYLKTPVF